MQADTWLHVATTIRSVIEANDDLEDNDEGVTEEFTNLSPNHLGKVQFGAPQKPCTFETLEDQNHGIPLFRQFQMRLAAFLIDTLPEQGIALPPLQNKYVLAHQQVSLRKISSTVDLPDV